MAVKHGPFTPESTTPLHKVRLYDRMVVSETRVEAGFDEAGSRGFQLWFLRRNEIWIEVTP